MVPKGAHLSDEGSGLLLGHHSHSKLPPQSDISIWSVHIVEL